MDTCYSSRMFHPSLPVPSQNYNHNKAYSFNCTEYVRDQSRDLENNGDHIFMNHLPYQNLSAEHSYPVLFCRNATNQMPTGPKAGDVLSYGSADSWGICAGMVSPEAPLEHWWSRLEPPKLDFSDNLAGSILEEENDIGYFSFSNRSQCSYSSDNSDSFVHSENQPTISSDLDELLDDLVSVVKEMSDKDLPKCYVCGEMFKSSSSRNEHMRSHRQSRERPHECEYCGKRFSAKSALKTHVRKHTGEKPYSCPHCCRAFADKSSQRKHLRIHTGEKPYTCDVCGQKFTQSGNMARHKLIHNKAEL